MIAEESDLSEQDFESDSNFNPIPHKPCVPGSLLLPNTTSLGMRLTVHQPVLP